MSSADTLHAQSGDPYLDFQVERSARLHPDSPSPIYPDMLRTAGVNGEVLASFVVDANGRAEISSFKVIRSSHELLTLAVKNALPRMTFIAAEIGGRKVRQLVQMPFSFSLPASNSSATGSAGSSRESGAAQAMRAPDISELSPRKRASLLYERTMIAAESGNSSNVGTFAPMTIAAYEQVVPLIIDDRLHIGMVHLAQKNVQGAKAQADTIQQQSPTHLFASLLRARAGEVENNTFAIQRAKSELRANWDRERARNLSEYADHLNLLELAIQETGPASRPVERNDRTANAGASGSTASPAAAPPIPSPVTQAKLSPLRPSVADAGRTAELAVLNAASNSCSDADLIDMQRLLHATRVNSVREIEGDAERSGSNSWYRTLQEHVQGVSKTLESGDAMSAVCPRLYKDLAGVWTAQARRINDHRNGVATTVGAAAGAAAGAAIGRIANRPSPQPPSESRDAAGAVDHLESVEESKRGVGCVKVEQEGNNHFVRNVCSDVKIMWKIYDEKSCPNGCAGWAMDGLAPGRRETVLPLAGQVWFASCEYPRSILTKGRDATGRPAAFDCERLPRRRQ